MGTRGRGRTGQSLTSMEERTGWGRALGPAIRSY